MPLFTDPRFRAGSYKNLIRKFGRLEAGADDTRYVLCDSPAPYDGWLENEEAITIRSTSVEDAPGGLGTSYVQWTGQGADGIEKTYFTELNGTTPVDSDVFDPGVKWDIIYRALSTNREGTNLSPVTDPANRGDIIFESKTTGKEMARIKAGLGRTQMMIYRIPLNKTGEFKGIDLFPDSNQPVKTEVYARSGKTISWQVLGIIDKDNESVSLQFPEDMPEYLAPGVDIAIVVTPEQNNTNISAQMFIKLKDIPNYEELKAKGEVQ